MYYRLLRNDIRRSKAITLTIILFVAGAAMLVALAAILPKGTPVYSRAWIGPNSPGRK